MRRIGGLYWLMRGLCQNSPHGMLMYQLMKYVGCSERHKKKSLWMELNFSTYESLPEQIKIYRGEQFGGNRKGLSWTMDRNIAEWFAKRFQKNGYVKSGIAYKDDILAYFNCRNEKEIVISKVHDVSTEPILNALADVFAHP